MIVITPLITIMDKQTRKLEGLGFRTTYLRLDASQNELIENCEFDFVFGSPESFLNEKKKKWRDMLTSSVYQSKLGLIAVDVAHTVIQW